MEAHGVISIISIHRVCHMSGGNYYYNFIHSFIQRFLPIWVSHPIKIYVDIHPVKYSSQISCCCYILPSFLLMSRTHFSFLMDFFSSYLLRCSSRVLLLETFPYIFPQADFNCGIFFKYFILASHSDWNNLKLCTLESFIHRLGMPFSWKSNKVMKAVIWTPYMWVVVVSRTYVHTSLLSYFFSRGYDFLLFFAVLYDYSQRNCMSHKICCIHSFCDERNQNVWNIYSVQKSYL